MKKSILGLAALALLASCNNDEDIQLADKAVIGFNGVFVENSTRANDLTRDNILDFGVFGSVVKGENSGLIFNNTEVYKSGTAFKYDLPQYWVTSADYDFVAIAPFTDAHWSYGLTTSTVARTGVITFDNAAAAANQDLLFAYATRTTAEAITTQPEAVGFTFNHMLSRVFFTFKNDFAPESNITLKVTNVKINDAHKKGTLAIKNGVAAEAWIVDDNSGDNAFARLFGDAGEAKAFAGQQSASTEHFYLIPANDTYNVTFDVELIQAGVSLKNYEHSVNVALNMAKGNSYNIKASLTPGNVAPDGQICPIEFTVTEVKDWTNATDIN
jgi:hypothetical protein